MIKCSDECMPCCDFCIYVVHEIWIDEEDEKHIGGPIKCNLHLDETHQKKAENCGECDDFHCFLAEN